MKNKQTGQYLDEKEIRKRRRERIAMLVAVCFAVVFTLVASRLSSGSEMPFSTSVLVFGLLSVNVILILLLLFLIVRNVFKLFSERRKGIIGSKLRTKLVAAFVGLSLVPTILLFLFAINFLSYSIEF